MVAAQTALAEKNYPEAIRNLEQADAYAKKTAYDQHVINLMAGNAYGADKEYLEARKRLETVIRDGFTAKEEMQRLVKLITELAYNEPDYAKAIEYGSRAIRDGYADATVRTAVLQAYYKSGDWKALRKFEQDEIGTQIAQGLAPQRDSLRFLYTACVKLNDKRCQADATQKFSKYYASGPE
jgi:hypothetical protein